MLILRPLLLANVITTMAAACAGTGASPPQPLTMPATTLMSGWEEHFTVEWAATPTNGGRRITGRVYDHKGEYAEDVRLLAQALDASGTVIDQHIASVRGGVGSAGAYFEVPNLPAASAYRVTVWDYTLATSKSKH
jgi:hypothetical protein